MAPLVYHRSRMLSAGGTPPSRIRIDNLPKCKLRIINVQNETLTVGCMLTAEIIPKNALIGTSDTIAIFQRQWQTEAGIDVGWEGDIDLGIDQDLRITFESTLNNAPTLNDVLVATVGYEPLG